MISRVVVVEKWWKFVIHTRRSPTWNCLGSVACASDFACGVAGGAFRLGLT